VGEWGRSRVACGVQAGRGGQARGAYQRVPLSIASIAWCRIQAVCDMRPQGSLERMLTLIFTHPLLLDLSRFTPCRSTPDFPLCFSQSCPQRPHCKTCSPPTHCHHQLSAASQSARPCPKLQALPAPLLPTVQASARCLCLLGARSWLHAGVACRRAGGSVRQAAAGWLASWLAA
jgi:hypothetical protein